jgi:hypothetical protein
MNSGQGFAFPDSPEKAKRPGWLLAQTRKGRGSQSGR